MRGSSRSPNSARISSASSRSACLLGLHRGAGAPARAQARRRRRCTGHAGAPPQPRVRADQHVVEHAQVAEHAAVLEGAREAERGELLGRQAGDVAAREVDAAGVRRVEPGDEIEQRGLAGAVRPDDADQLALGDGERQRVDGGDAAEAARQPLDLAGSAPSHRPHQALRAEADQQQQRDAVDQHAVLGGGAEQLRQADQQRPRRRCAPATLPSPPRITMVSASSETCDVKVSWFT